MKADDVCRLCLCPVCGKLGDERAMIKAGPMACLAHDRCVFEQLGDTLIATQLLIVLWGLYRFTSSPKSEHNGSFPMQPSVRSEPPLLLLI